MQVVETPGASVVIGQLTAGAAPDGDVKLSLTPTPLRVTVLVLVTVKL